VLVQEVGATPVLVGAHPAYRHLGLEVVEDAVPGIGPVGGLLGLLRFAPRGVVLAIANDLPFVTRELLDTLLARFDVDWPALLPQRGDRLEPLCAAYRSALMLAHVEQAVRDRSFGLQRIARGAGARALPLDGALAACLDDWDEPQDIAPG
jgi:molybdopterin-guanine dinucleotide biosynthesis protein A